MFFFYKFLTTILFPFFILIIYIRKLFGKEDNKRFKEKFIFKKKNKNNSKLIWFHGASIGEILSVIPIIEYLQKKNTNLEILITTVTLSSSKIIEKKFHNNEKLTHHFFPLDVNYLVKKFLDNWNPNAIIFIDSEIWPNFLLEINKRKIPLALINARITNKTFKKWIFFKKFSSKIFSFFDICLASSNNSRENLKKLNAQNVKYVGNLKFLSNSTADKKLKKSTIKYFNTRNVWCASNTHKGEEIFCLHAHMQIKKKYNDVLTIIIPRHINRVNNILSLCKKNKLNAQIVKNENEINNTAEIIIIESFGELSKYYNYCKSVFIGKSILKNLISVGGQNPIEAAVNGCRIYHGPYIYNFFEVYEYLNKINISAEVRTVDNLTKHIINDLYEMKKTNSENINKINDNGKKIFEETVNQLNDLILK